MIKLIMLQGRNGEGPIVRLITRRNVLRAGAGLVGAGFATTSYAFAIEPGFRLAVQEYRLSPPGWGGRPPLSICVIADLHAGDPWMTLSRVRRIVAAANALGPDLHVVLGDLPAHHRYVTRKVPMPDVAEALSALRAKLGRFAILGNHDWWDDRDVQRWRRGPPAIRSLLEVAGVPVLANGARRLPHGSTRDEGVWLCGTDSTMPFGWRNQGMGAADLRAALAPIDDDAPAILLAHEPDIFPHVPARVALTLSGHTHGGQVRLFGHSAVVPSRYGNRYAYGLVEEGGRRLIVSGGLGCSMIPVRLGVPPELTLVTLS